MTSTHTPHLPPRVAGFFVAFATPRRLPNPDTLPGRVAVLDIAFASQSGGSKNSFERTTLRFIERLGERLVAWVDHHDSDHHARFAGDPRFRLARKAEHGACPEMIDGEVIARAGHADTIVCHGDFDGLASAAKWIRGGREPYPGCDDDARAIDTRTGLPSETGARFDRAIRARPRDPELALSIVQLLVAGLEGDFAPVDEAGRALAPLEARATALAKGYRRLTDELVCVEASGDYDRTLLLLLGQQLATMAVVVDGDTATFAAPYDSGVNFLERFGLSGGMPTLVSVHRARLGRALALLGVDAREAKRLQATD